MTKDTTLLNLSKYQKDLDITMLKSEVLEARKDSFSFNENNNKNTKPRI
jgi:hypothetical protein